MCSFTHKIKTWTTYFVYVFLASPNTNYLKRVKVHAIRREPPTSVLDSIRKLGDFGIQESKSGCSSFMSFFIFISAHRHFGF